MRPVNEEVSRAGEPAVCDAWIVWPDRRRFECERDGEHDGAFAMHVATIDGEHTNWSDSAPGAGRG